MEIARSPSFVRLKSHKAFPRRVASVEVTAPAQSRVHEETHPSPIEKHYLDSTHRIRSWIPEPSTTQLSADHGLPLTPPSNSSEDISGSWIEDSPLREHVFTTTYTSGSSGIVTPVLQRSPPTPETTPPRLSRTYSTLIPPLASRKTSSRTASFKTAREELSSDDEGRRHEETPPTHPAEQHWMKVIRHTRLRDVGLGLGMESEEDDHALREMMPGVSPKTYDFVTFDGTWSGSRDGLNNARYEESQHSPRIGLVRRRKRPQISTRSPPTSPKVGQIIQPYLTDSISLRQRVENNRQSPPSASTEKFAAQIQWPLRDESLDIDAKLREVDNRRLSQMSTTSTVVEVMVISTPPPKRRTLRHTGRILSPGSFDTSVHRSNQSSMISTDHLHRHSLRHIKSPEGGPQKRYAADTPTSVSSSLANVHDAIPVIVIPERRSSLKSSAPSSRHLSRTISLTSARQESSRPTTAPDEGVGYFDLPRRERRTMSATIPVVMPSKPECRIVKETPPALIAHNSSPSVLTSRNFSRRSSVTSASMIAQDGQEGHYSQVQPVLQITEPFETQNSTLDRTSTGDWSTLRPRSALVTPFSLRSARSSTPGTLEVNEATAVSIYPHTNKSILVVQQLPRRDSQPPEQSTVIAGNANFMLPGPTKPNIVHQSAIMPDPIFEEGRRSISSLQNPREPPQPPVFKLIPPTPANNTPVDDADHQIGQYPSAAAAKKPFIGVMKRAISARRYSGSLITPLTRSLSISRRNTISAPRPMLGDDPESKLYPFWRPRGFWDGDADSENDSDSEFGNFGLLGGNSLGGQQQRHSMPLQSTSLSQRLGLPRLRGHRRSASEDFQGAAVENKRRNYNESTENENSDYEVVQPGRNTERLHSGTIMPRLGYQVQFVGFKGLQKRMEKRKERREEGKRERVREKLRGSIGVVIPREV